MPGLHGFSYDTPAASLLEREWHPDVAPAVSAIAEMLDGQERNLNEFFTFGLQGTRGTTTFTAATGGVPIYYINPYDGTQMVFQRVPYVLTQILDGGGANAVVKDGATTTSGFTAQVYLAGVEQDAVDFTITWLAIV